VQGHAPHREWRRAVACRSRRQTAAGGPRCAGRRRREVLAAGAIQALQTEFFSREGGVRGRVARAVGGGGRNWREKQRPGGDAARAGARGQRRRECGGAQARDSLHPEAKRRGLEMYDGETKEMYGEEKMYGGGGGMRWGTGGMRWGTGEMYGE
jgi:hypothetical protein